MLKYWPGLPINSLLGFFLFTYAYYGENGVWPVYQESLVSLFVAILLTNLSGAFIWGVNRKLDGVLSWKNLMERRFMISIFLNPVLGLLTIWGPLVLWILIGSGWEEVEYLYNEYRGSFIRISVGLFFLTFIFSLVDFTFFSYRFWVNEKIRKIKINREQKAVQYDLLRSQLSPHYLFNCLNTINSLTHKDPDLAEQFIRRFAASFQYILKTHNQKLVKLEEEVAFVKDYIFMLQIRYQSNLKVSWEIDTEWLDSPIPPLTLQLLIENAVKHNAVSSDQSLVIEISTDEKKGLEVKNNRTQKPAGEDSFGIGLESIKQRYAFFSPHPVTITDTNDFSVQLPALPLSLIK